jgi:hypothetical protein
MKRALTGIVPDDLLNRRRKAFVPPEPEKDGLTEYPSPLDIGQYVVGSCLGIIDLDRFGEALQKARRNEEAPIGSMKRTLTLELWLRHLAIRGVLTNPTPIKKQVYSSALGAKEPQTPTQPKSLAS